MTVTFPCPLCGDTGHDVVITATLVTLMGVPMIAELAGCPHATGFGDVDQLTLDEERRLIYAALSAAETWQHGDDAAEADAS